MIGGRRRAIADRAWRRVMAHTRQLGRRWAASTAGAHSGPDARPDPGTVRVLVTVGTELPFDRLVAAVDEWAAERGRTAEVFAQIGASPDPPVHIAWSQFVDPAVFHEYFCSADLVIAHAGMGTILSALRYQRPLVVMPRRADLGEHRNDHQFATARRLAAQGRIEVAIDEKELIHRLDDAIVEPKAPIGPHASDELIGAIADAIHRRPLSRRR